MKKLSLILIFSGVTFGFAQSNTVSIKAKPYNTSGKKVIVYTTADSTSYRLSPTDTVTLKRWDNLLKHKFVCSSTRLKHSSPFWELAAH
ncbi:MAG: hypothetical protein ABI358_07135 [Ginsengibacter sp.]